MPTWEMDYELCSAEDARSRSFGDDGIDVCADWKTNMTPGLNGDAKKTNSAPTQDTSNAISYLC